MIEKLKGFLSSVAFKPAFYIFFIAAQIMSYCDTYRL